MLFTRRRRAAPLAVVLAGATILVPLIVGSARSAPSAAPARPPLLTSPPLFAAAGRTRTVAAEVPAEPAAVRLVVTGGSGPPAAYPMQHTGGMRWTGTIPGADAGAELRYSVAADYADRSVSSDEAHLIVLGRTQTVVPKLVPDGGTTMLTLRLGDVLGSRGGDEGATEIPPSFAVDEAAGEVLFLDAANRRIVAFDMSGRLARIVPLETETATDMILDRGSRTARVLDQPGDALFEIAGGSTRRTSGLGVRGAPSGARLGYDARAGEVFVRDATQGGYVPVARNGPSQGGAQRAGTARPGQPTPIGDLVAEVDDGGLTLGLIGSTSTGFRISLPDVVLDAGETVVDPDGIVWALVGLVDRVHDAAYAELVRLDPATGTAEATRVPASVPGDVTRRLAPASHGVVLLEGEGDTLRLIAFGGR